jgi:hypothetical protein
LDPFNKFVNGTLLQFLANLTKMVISNEHYLFAKVGDKITVAKYVTLDKIRFEQKTLLQ